jgi:hypothetical protein
MRQVRTRPPSFPDAPPDTPLTIADKVRWQVVCGDAGHWRLGIYSPPEASAAECRELERHDCPELFLLLSGRITLLLSEKGKVRELPLEQNRPVLIRTPHAGFCPGGPNSGTALVIERDRFDTEYRELAGW